MWEISYRLCDTHISHDRVSSEGELRMRRQGEARVWFKTKPGVIKQDLCHLIRPSVQTLFVLVHWITHFRMIGWLQWFIDTVQISMESLEVPFCSGGIILRPPRGIVFHTHFNNGLVSSL